MRRSRTLASACPTKHLRRHHTVRPLGGLRRLATGRWTGLPLLFLVVVAYSIATALFMIGVWKIVQPDGTGLFVNHAGGGRSVMFVVSDARAAVGRDLGYWLVPIALLISLAIHLAMSALLRRLTRNDVR